MPLGQGDGGSGDQGDAFVGRTEQQIELDARLDDSLGIETPQSGQGAAAVEQAGVKKVRADATGFKSKLTESQYTPVDGKIEKVALIVPHGVVALLKLEKEAAV